MLDETRDLSKRTSSSQWIPSSPLPSSRITPPSIARTAEAEATLTASSAIPPRSAHPPTRRMVEVEGTPIASLPRWPALVLNLFGIGLVFVSLLQVHLCRFRILTIIHPYVDIICIGTHHTCRISGREDGSRRAQFRQHISLWALWVLHF
ncbi:hypothetical protein JAAARDRAFT_648522 [Jaapia argillacea MUCL 33604]|uniref:Uncharacterized protein n=1 Tax=Jaapia argillacea MUCL 33604 TaxID=933084 RepID=A0A067PVX7_9AGAM|nr:hypothetical protein JAAARDRAFT_648522 [Jaapia argillacea MUCL 33604]